jgi:TetR/AcrR family transcriptional repressor of nem operon
MRYSDTHKEETRKKVVRAAAAAVRAKGPDGVGVAEIMAEAGLTHGGFYAHFPNKEALVAAAIEEAFGQSRRRFARMTEGMSPNEALETFVDAYVSADHRNNPQRGCPISTLTNDLPRQGPLVRAAFDTGVANLIGRLEAWLPEGDTAARRSLASSLMAEMAGAVALARAVSDEALADEVLSGSRDRVKARAGLTGGAS